MALHGAIDDRRRGDRAGAILLLVGVVNIPVIYFSVKWWNTLHQGATIRLNEASTMDDTMMTAMLIMTFGFWAYSIAVGMDRVRNIILEREHNASWVKKMIGEKS
jgi:heme exporter protein C